MITKAEFKNYGSFRDSMKAPVHRWFTYPAGYSYKFVESKIEANNLKPGCWIADPFLGTGTTSVTGKMAGINSLGIEAHPFVYWVAQTKMKFDYDLSALFQDVQKIINLARSMENSQYNDLWPELVRKCFGEDNLHKLFALKKSILDTGIESSHKELLKLALTATLRIVTTAGSGWPYIAPSKYAEKTVTHDAFKEFEKQCLLMISDLAYVHSLDLPFSEHKIVQGDARQLTLYTQPESIDLIITSPPYLNNYDYADRTRLETYFWGIYNSWGEITRNVRDNLMVAATTQVRLGKMNGIRDCPTIKKLAPDVHELLVHKIHQLSDMRMIKAGKKTYDYVVASYFEDMVRVLSEAFTVLKPGRQFILVLGDSAPYGVHIPTEEIIGRIGVALGFRRYELEVLRKRGDKWAHNPQRHSIPLRECVLSILK